MLSAALIDSAPQTQVPPHRLFDSAVRLYARFEIRRSVDPPSSGCLPSSNRSLENGSGRRPAGLGGPRDFIRFFGLFLDRHIRQVESLPRRATVQFPLPASLP